MHRFFVDPSQINENKAVICGDDVKHISKVLRLKCGDTVELCDGKLNDYICTISSVEKDEICAEIKEKKSNLNESPLCITLYQGIPKGDKMDYIIQKCVELGVNKIVPVAMKRTVVKVKTPYFKSERWQRISLEAAKQCRRGIIPEVSEPISFDNVLKEISGSGALNILPYENEDVHRLKDVLNNNLHAERVNLIIGPEGGFDDEEITLARLKNVNTVTLGPRIMRCETAPVAAVSAVMYALGDW